MQNLINRTKKQLPHYFSIWSLLEKWPDHIPLCLLGGKTGYAILAISFSEVSSEEVLKRPFKNNSQPLSDNTPFSTGYMGVISYSDYNKPTTACDNEYPSRFFRVYEALIFDQDNKKIYHTKENNYPSPHYNVPKKLWDKAHNKEFIEFPKVKGFPLVPTKGDAHYLNTLNKILEDIRSGRYYQINFLRYFTCQDTLDFKSLLSRYYWNAGPQACWFKFPDWEIVSFSPERFIEVLPQSEKFLTRTYPIKGTAPTCDDPQINEETRQKLATSEKDLAELHMIVDLMRNDLNRISLPATVNVMDPGSVHTFKKVHHLIAHVESYLEKDLTFDSFLQAISPGGSITGAPKIEVMKAIYEYENRPRGYFMGNAFYWDYESGRFDSSILIRTLVRESKEPTFSYAAGGGIVIASKPQGEMNEVAVKCRVVTD